MAVTDIQRWSDVGSEAAAWSERSRYMALFVRPGETLFDFGAGVQAVRNLIPTSCRYVPIDCVAIAPGTFVWDYNSGFSVPDGPGTSFMSGFLEYIVDVQAFFAQLRARKSGQFIILSYAINRDRHHSWLNDLGDASATHARLSEHIADLRVVGDYGGPDNQLIMTGCLRS